MLYQIKNTVSIDVWGAKILVIDQLRRDIISIDAKSVNYDGLVRLQHEWMNEDEIASAFFPDGTHKTDYVSLYTLLVEFQKKEILDVCITEDGNKCFIVHPFSYNISEYKGIEYGKSYCLNRFVYLRRTKRGLTMESSFTHHQITICAPSLCETVLKLSSEEGFSIEKEEATTNTTQTKFLNILLSLKWMESAGTLDALPHWSFHDRLFFYQTTLVNKKDFTVGKHHVETTSFDCPPTFKKIYSDNIIQLPIPEATKIQELMSDSLLDTLNNRQSRRLFSKDAISLETFSAFLYSSMRIRNIKDLSAENETEDKFGRIISSRPFPSGGARHAIEAYLRIRNVEEIPDVVYHYDPMNHQLEQIAHESKYLKLLDVYPFPQKGESELPQVMMYFSVRLARISWRYSNIAYRLALLDLGCLLQTLSLTAEALKLSGCILGVVDNDVLSNVFQTDCNQEPFIGCYAVGLEL